MTDYTFTVVLTTDEPGWTMNLSANPDLRRTPTSRTTVEVRADDERAAYALARDEWQAAHPGNKVLGGKANRHVWYDVTFRRRSDKRKRMSVPVCINEGTLAHRSRGMSAETWIARQARRQGKGDWSELRDAGEVIAVAVSPVQ
jgi:hypothetical protein